MKGMETAVDDEHEGRPQGYVIRCKRVCCSMNVEQVNLGQENGIGRMRVSRPGHGQFSIRDTGFKNNVVSGMNMPAVAYGQKVSLGQDDRIDGMPMQAPQERQNLGLYQRRTIAFMGMGRFGYIERVGLAERRRIGILNMIGIINRKGMNLG